MVPYVIKPDVKIAYNGIEGSFSHQVAIIVFPSLQNMSPVPNPRGLEKGLMNGKYDIGLMPLVNSTARAVEPTLDTLIDYRSQLHIFDSFGLLVDQRVGGFCNPKDVKYVASHPKAISQCRGSLQERFPNYRPIPGEDTALSIKNLAADRNLDPENPARHYPRNTAVVGSEVAFRLYGVPMYEESNIADAGNKNITMFLLLRRRITIPETLQLDEARRLLGLGILGQHQDT